MSMGLPSFLCRFFVLGDFVKLKIGKYIWTYEEVDSIGDSIHLGRSEYPKLAITVRKGMQPIPYKVTVLHELLHSLYDSAGYKFETQRDCENSIDILSNKLVEFIEDNKKFFKDRFLK